MSMSERAPATPAGTTGATGASGDGAGRATDKVKERLRETTQELGQRTRRVAETARERIAGEVSTAAKSGAECVATGFRDVGDALSQACDTLRERNDGRAATYVSGAADGMKRASRYFEERSPEQIARDAGGIVRRNPALVLGGLFAAGLLAGRFLRASSPDAREHRRARREGYGGQGMGYGSSRPDESAGSSYGPSRGYGSSSPGGYSGYGTQGYQGTPGQSASQGASGQGSSQAGSQTGLPPTIAPEHTGNPPYRPGGTEGSEAL